MRRYLVFAIITLGVVVLDQWTKYLVVQNLTAHFDGQGGAAERWRSLYADPAPPPGNGYHFAPRGEVEIAQNFLRLRYAENPGAAWGLFHDLPARARGLLFHVVSLGAVAVISVYFTRLSGRPAERWAMVGLPLVLGGAIGNYVDRLSRSFVIDFIEAHWFDRAHWPSFNLADMAITAGVLCLMVDALVRRERKSAPIAARS
ncbi:MAG TPA: signal peptidase II [Myxococcaceae bacterium]|nr:signal peptidase II [Myxococcaceae bacterium]